MKKLSKEELKEQGGAKQMQPLVCKMLCYFSQDTPRGAIPVNHLPFPKKDSRYWISAFGWFNIQQTHLRIWTGANWDGKTNTEKARASPRLLLPVNGWGSRICSHARWIEISLCAWCTACFSIQTPSLLLHPSTPPDGASAQQEASSSWQKQGCVAMLLTFIALC